MIFPDINRSQRIKKPEKQLRHAQRKLSRKYRYLIKRTGTKTVTKALKVSGPVHANMDKAVRKVQALQARLKAVRHDDLRKAADRIAKARPSYVTVEHLSMKNMLKNRHLSKSVSSQCWYAFRMYLVEACRKMDIEVREVSAFYPSGKTCHACGHIHKSLKLKDRIYGCPECGYTEDRD